MDRFEDDPVLAEVEASCVTYRGTAWFDHIVIAIEREDQAPPL